jgi:hypothetical protein
MQRAQIEYITLQVVDDVSAGLGVEDDAHIELKGQWPTDFRKTARQIAAHANAARGAEILWLIGIDEKNGVTGAKHEELANWWPQVESFFDGPSPTLASLVVHPESGPSIIVLVFETDAAPYVVATGENPVSREVPWREATRARSATRSDLLRILVPQIRLPSAETMTASLSVYKRHADYADIWSWSINGTFYLERVVQGPIFFPWHRQEARIEFSTLNYALNLSDSLHLYPHDPNSRFRQMVGSTGSDRVMTMASAVEMLIADGPGLVEFSATQIPVEGGPAVEMAGKETCAYVLKLYPSDSDLAVELRGVLAPSEPLGDALLTWTDSPQT